MNNNFNGNSFSQFNSLRGPIPNYGNFNKAFNPIGTMIPYNKFEKPNDLGHDNVEDNVLDEIITEKRIRINSYDRDTSYYLDPFDFRVIFNPQGDTVYKDPKTLETSMIYGSPHPVIRSSFSNVKYIKLENISLPSYSDYDLENLAITNFLNDDEDALDWTKVKIIKSDGTTMDIKTVVEDETDETITTENLDLVIDYINDELIDTALIDFRSSSFSDEDPDPLASRTQITRLYDVSLDMDYYFDVDTETWKIYKPNTTSYLYDDLYVALDIEEFRDANQTHGTNKQLQDAFGLIYPYRRLGYFYWEGATHDASLYFKNSDLKNVNRLTFKFYNSSGEQIKFDHLSRNAVSTKDARHPKNKSIQLHMTFTLGIVEAQQNRRTNFR